jgi:hypothetical protein
MSEVTPIWVTCCGYREQSARPPVNFGLQLAQEPMPNTNSASVISLAGLGDRVADPRLEIADLYRVSKLKLIARGEPGTAAAPWHGVPPPLAVYRERGHRRLAATAYESQCSSCIWGCAMAVEMIIDQWKPDRRRYRTETFCYGPLSCSKYRPGPTRKVPGRSGMAYEEQDWVDQDATSHRGRDE